MDNYVPDILEEKYARFLVVLGRCPACHKYMIVKPHRARNTFSRYHKLTFDAQAKAARLVIKSDSQIDGKSICEDCAGAGKASFVCALCKERKSSDKIQERIGDPPEFLCTDCYETVPAKKWENIWDQLECSHRWDFE